MNRIIIAIRRVKKCAVCGFYYAMMPSDKNGLMRAYEVDRKSMLKNHPGAMVDLKTLHIDTKMHKRMERKLIAQASSPKFGPDSRPYRCLDAS